ncbi:MAG TPA: MBL fold metallo-hydrolase [Spirochaetota bacterium]|nr:MBL fold metallo-hydrolase [Spirochaetota bacterium]
MKCGYLFSNFQIPSEANNYSLKCLTFVIISKDYGAMIFDTGSPFNPEEVLTQLKENFDLNPEDIKWVFNTHFHPDHVGTNKYFKKAKFIFPKRDLQFACEVAEVVFSNKDLLKFLFDRCPGYIDNFTKTEETNIKYYFKNFWSDENLGLKLTHGFIEDNTEIPDFIIPLETFGHTHYSYSFKILSEINNYYITGDSVSNRLILKSDNLERLTDPHMDFDKYFKTIDFFKKQNGIIIPGHDRPFYMEDSTPIKEKVFEI